MQPIESTADWVAISSLLIDEGSKENSSHQPNMDDRMRIAEYKKSVMEAYERLAKAAQVEDLQQRDKRSKIVQFLRRGRWRFAIEIANTEDAKIFLYSALREVLSDGSCLIFTHLLIQCFIFIHSLICIFNR